VLAVGVEIKDLIHIHTSINPAGGNSDNWITVGQGAVQSNCLTTGRIPIAFCFDFLLPLLWSNCIPFKTSFENKVG